MKKIKYAVMGLGHIAQVAVLPAFKHAPNAELVSLISEDPKKLKKISKMYKVREENCYSFRDFPACLVKAEVDVLYLATPNDTHVDYVIDALNEGVHVLCEKPLAITLEDCDRIINASENNNRLLMTAYRLHFEKANLEAVKLAQTQKKLGELKIFNSTFTMQVKDEDNIRLNDTTKGGGPMWDIGIYCINAARYLFRDEPCEVFAFSENGGEERFSRTDEMINVLMRFPKNRLASFVCSFGADACAAYDLVGTKGRLHVEKAYEYASKRELTFLKDDEAPKKKTFKKADQFAAELIYFSNCVAKNIQPEPSAYEARADVKIILAILESIDNNEPIRLRSSEYNVSHPQPRQMINKPGNEEPDLVNVTAPTD
jgi:predicted dehydrogenase